MDITVDGNYEGRLTFELFEDTPLTTENFKCLCTGEKGISPISGLPLHYKGSKIHKVFPNYIIQGGDFTRGDGRGGESIYGKTFPDENFNHNHTGPGLLAMANSGEKDSSNSQFFISVCQEPNLHLNGKYVVFGRLKAGTELIREIAKLGDIKTGKPKAEIIISDCGIAEKTEHVEKNPDEKENESSNEIQTDGVRTDTSTAEMLIDS